MDNISLNKELNDWCGTKNIDFLSESCGLCNLFTYVVPKLRDGCKGWTLLDINFSYDADWITCNIELYKEGGMGLCDTKNFINTIREQENTEAEALAQACLEAFKELQDD